MSNFDLAEKYVDGTATNQELEEIQAKLAEDASFKEEVVHLQALKAMFQAEKQEQLYQELGNLFDKTVKPKLAQPQLPETKIRKLPIIRNAWAIAASVTLLLAAIVTFQFLLNKDNTSDLYASNFKPFKASNVRSEVKEGIYWSAVELYQKQDYKAALGVFQDVSNEKYQNQRYLFMGNCHLMLGQTEEAIVVLQKVDEKSEFIADAKWYLALSYLKKDRVEKAASLLEELTKQGNLYQNKAQKLLEDIR